MKKFTIISLYFLGIVSLFLGVGCENDLEENPLSLVTPSTFYKTDDDFKAAINGAIKPLYGGWGGFDFNAPLILCAGAEDVTSRPTSPELRQFDIFKPTLNYSAAIGLWTRFYNTINACNGIISNINSAEEVSEENRNSYEGQARYLRALSYFYLTRWFGEIPIITSENQLDAISTGIGQSPVIDIYAHIVEDLSVAENFLPASFDERGRPTQGSAKTLLAEVYLNMTGWPLKDNSKYALARDKAKEVMDAMNFSLEPNFADLWKVNNKLSNTEFIFMFNGIATNTSASSHVHQSSRPGEEGGWNDIMSEARFFNVFPEGPRKDATFWTVFADEAQTTWENSNIGQPYIAKYRDGGAGASAEQAGVNSFHGDGFFVVSRYAEVLLIYAEAANMAEGGPSDASLEAINQVRRRASGNNQVIYPDLVTGMSVEEFDDAVIAERNWEFAFEAKRWFDLVRKEMVVEVNQALYPYVDAHNMLLPKPQTEVDLIPGLEQNAGY